MMLRAATSVLLITLISPALGLERDAPYIWGNKDAISHEVTRFRHSHGEYVQIKSELKAYFEGKFLYSNKYGDPELHFGPSEELRYWSYGPVPLTATEWWIDASDSSEEKICMGFDNTCFDVYKGDEEGFHFIYWMDKTEPDGSDRAGAFLSFYLSDNMSFAWKGAQERMELLEAVTSPDRFEDAVSLLELYEDFIDAELCVAAGYMSPHVRDLVAEAGSRALEQKGSGIDADKLWKAVADSVSKRRIYNLAGTEKWQSCNERDDRWRMQYQTVVTPQSRPF